MKNIEQRIINIENELFGKSGTFWHSKGELSDGSRIGKIGASMHLIDENDYPISKGYHEIIVRGCGHYIGHLGASKTEFHCHRAWDLIMEGD